MKHIQEIASRVVAAGVSPKLIAFSTRLAKAFNGSGFETLPTDGGTCQFVPNDHTGSPSSFLAQLRMVSQTLGYSEPELKKSNVRTIYEVAKGDFVLYISLHGTAKNPLVVVEQL